MGIELLRVKQAAEALGIGQKTTRKLIRDGKLGCVRFGERPIFRIPKAAIAEFIERESGVKPESE